MLKAVSWRILGCIDTFVLSLLFTHKPFLAASIAGTETITKILLCYFHERAWASVPWGRRPLPAETEQPAAAAARAPAHAAK